MKRKQGNSEGTKNGNRKNNNRGCRERVSFDNLFDAEWEELVITKDKTGKIVAKLSCCAGAPLILLAGFLVGLNLSKRGLMI